MRETFLLFVLALMLPFSGCSILRQKQSLTEVDIDGLKRAVAEQKGKVVFVNFWATWCAPCVAEFPDMVKLHQEYHAKGLEVIAVSFDLETQTAIPFLDRQKADFINLWKSPKLDDNDFMRGFDPECAGALPASWLFDQKGTRVYYHVGKFNAATVHQEIAHILTASK